MSNSYPDAFLLYAENVRPNLDEAIKSLECYRSCAIGTGRATPDVATYCFRIDERLTDVYRSTWPLSFSTESIELYLTPDSFRDHGKTEELVEGLTRLWTSVGREHIRIFWIGPRPESDIVHAVFHADPRARPLATLRLKTFDQDVAETARQEELALVSLGLNVDPDRAADCVDMIDTIADTLTTVTFVSFFHPDRRDELRLFMTLPVEDGATLAESLAPLREHARDSLAGHVQAHHSATGLETVKQALDSAGLPFTVSPDRYEGYIVHQKFCAAD